MQSEFFGDQETSLMKTHEKYLSRIDKTVFKCLVKRLCEQ